ncbi:MAG: alpha/beta hydrolase [Eubacteriales bacterium]|nr:alpha/beta hydrolase [Eubacteriales bacterium]
MKEYKKEILGKKVNIVEYHGEKGPIIAIHGLTGNSRNMELYADEFRGDYRFISVDVPGRGDSDDADDDTTFIKHAEIINALINDIGSSETILLGHSMGAYISALAASQNRLVSKMILLDGGAKVRQRHNDMVKPALGRISKTYDSKNAYIESVKSLYKNLGIEWNEVIENSANHEVGHYGNYWKNKSDERKIILDWNSASLFDEKEVYSTIDCPILLIYSKGAIGPLGTLFLWEEYDDVFRYAKNITTTVTNSNHYTIIFEKHQEIFDSIRQFLTE